MAVPEEHEKLIEKLFQEVDPTITVGRRHDRAHYTFEVFLGGEGYNYYCPRKLLDDGALDELRRLRDKFLSHPGRPTDPS